MLSFGKKESWESVYQKLIDDIKEEEGFRGEQYNDHLGFPTIGYGTKLPLTEDEAELLLKYRLEKFVKQLIMQKPFVEKLPMEARLILLNMSYQMGVNGVLKFKNMWEALEARDFKKAAYEMTDSKWNAQTPKRAQRLAARMKSIELTV